MRKNDYNDYLYESVTKICKKIKMSKKRTTNK